MLQLSDCQTPSPAGAEGPFPRGLLFALVPPSSTSDMPLLEYTFKIGEETFTCVQKSGSSPSNRDKAEALKEEFLRSYGSLRLAGAEVLDVKEVKIPTESLKANSAMLQVLEIVIGKLEVFSQPGNPMCGISREAREEARPYINTWILSPLLAVRDEMNRTTNLGDRIRALA